MDIWIYGHRIQNWRFGLEVGIDFKIGCLDLGPFRTLANLGPGLLGPGAGPSAGPGDLAGPGNPDHGIRRDPPGPGHPGTAPGTRGPRTYRRQILEPIGANMEHIWKPDVRSQNRYFCMWRYERTPCWVAHALQRDDVSRSRII